MPRAALLLREDSSLTLSTLVEKSQQKPPPHPLYDLQLTQSHLDLIEKFVDYKNQPIHQDEGFESDVDTVSIVSSDGSFETKTAETDSANGSAGSDSDTEPTPKTTEQIKKESHNLADCVCYSDVKVPDVLLFVIKREAFVFKFDSLKELRDFYLNFTALKAVTNQKTYSKNPSAKFNLLQRTDRNGVTHIEITREPDHAKRERTNIISLNTPEPNEGKKPNAANRQRSEPVFYDSEITRRLPNGNLVNEANRSLRKVWNSAEDLLDLGPKRPERRKRTKGKAPSPPVTPSDVMSGEYVRVNVNVDSNKDLIVKSTMTKSKPPQRPLVALLRPNLGQYKERQIAWTSSVPRLLPKQRSRSETRAFTPMAYRYIDTTPNYVTSSMGNRLFGLSPKLRDFPPKTDEAIRSGDSKWGSLGELTYNGRSKCCDSSNLKSVIKTGREDNGSRKNKNEKKVTFSAYTTVQVV